MKSKACSITHQEGNICTWASLRRSVSCFQMRTLARSSPQAPPGMCYLLCPGSLRSEVRPLSWGLPQERTFGPLGPVTIGQQSPSCLPYSLLFHLWEKGRGKSSEQGCMELGPRGVHDGSRPWWQSPAALTRGLRYPVLLHPVLSPRAISPRMCDVVAGYSGVPLSWLWQGHGAAVHTHVNWQVRTCGHLPQLRHWC